MKKWIARVLVLACVLGVAGCSSENVDKTKPVFETENISSITFFAAPNSNEGVEVPEEYIAQITAAARPDPTVMHRKIIFFLRHLRFPTLYTIPEGI